MSLNVDLQNNVLTLHVPGDLISTNAEAVRGEINGMADFTGDATVKWNVFRLDLSSAKMVDSVGLNLVVALFKQIERKGARMQVVYSSQNVFRTFAFTRLDKHIELVKA